MKSEQLEELLQQGIKAVESGDIHTAEYLLAQVAEQRKSPEVLSYLAYCLAHGQRNLRSAAKICNRSILREPNNSLHYLILGRIQLMANEKSKAIDTFSRGLRTSPNPKIIEEMKQIGFRKPAIMKCFERNHPINRLLGKTFHQLGLR